MMIPCNYEINISKEQEWYGRKCHVHYVRQELGDLMPDKAMEIFEDTKKRYPKEEGFKVTLYKVKCSATMIEEV